MRSGNSPQLACWSILAFGFQCYNHRHHSRWEDLGRAVRDGTKGGTRTHEISKLSVWCLANLATFVYMVLFICPRKHPARVRKFYLYPTYQKVLALRLIELTCSIYIPYPASGRRSVQLLRTSSRQFMRFLLHRRIVVLRIYWLMQTFALPTV